MAITVARRLPDQPQLAEKLVDLLEDKTLPPEFRAAGLYGLDELPLEDIESVADRLLSVGKQTGPEKKRLITFTRNNDHFVRKQDKGAARVSNPLGVNVRIGFLLSRLKQPDKELLPWLEDLRSNAKPYLRLYSDGSGGNATAVGILDQAIKQAKGESVGDPTPAGGVF